MYVYMGINCAYIYTYTYTCHVYNVYNGHIVYNVCIAFPAYILYDVYRVHTEYGLCNVYVVYDVYNEWGPFQSYLFWL